LSGGTSPINGELRDSNSLSVCNGSDKSYTCTVPNGGVGNLSFIGTDFNGYSCTGSSSYVASSSNQPVTLPINCVSVNTTHNLSVSFTGTGTGGNPSTGTLTSTLATCPTTNGNTPITCTESNTALGTSTWVFSGSTSSGSSCSGTGDYTVSEGPVARSVTLAVTCIPTRNLTLCLTKANFTTGTVIATPIGGSVITCSTPTGSCGSGSNSGTSSICSVPSGVGGGLSFSGVASGNKTCSVKTGAVSSYGVNDTTFNLELACQ
jgi:hypothetical protein